MSKNFKPLLYDCLNVGKHIKSTKKRHSWKFELDGHEHTVDLYVSKISGKRKVLVDGDIKIQTKKTAIYGSYPLRIGRHNLLVYEQEDHIFDLRVDNYSFESHYLRTRTQSDFRYNEQYHFDTEPNIPYREEANDPFYTRKAGDPQAYRDNPFNDSSYDYDDPFKNKDTSRHSLRGERRDRYEGNIRADGFRKNQEENEVWERYEDFSKSRKNDRDSPDLYGTPRRSEPPRVVERRPIPVSSPPPPPPKNEDVEVKKPQDQQNLLDAPYQISTLPTDIFTSNISTPSNKSKPNNNPFANNNQFGMSNNPFESQTSQPQANTFDWSAVSPRPETSKQPLPQSSSQPNGFPLGMPQIGAQAMPPNMQNQMQGVNPMAAMMAYNQFMTGMMMGQYMNSQQPFR
ncbi:unnamed protein product [Blepharisma stoltei]|uniref:FHA domain-containing protein n=1 Tax=Blepharisma stoltei TaxID=1481888 RepID=A0AAU9KHJ6_9CILI|nr:unnamed protein product [Blepharisma stoltei]